MRKLRYFLLALLLLPVICALCYAGTTLTASAVWCVGTGTYPVPNLVVPNPGDPVSAGAGSPGVLRGVFQCLTNRTQALAMGTVSLYGVTVDGVGAQTVTPTAGLVAAQNVQAQSAGAGVVVGDTTNLGISALHSYGFGFVSTQSSPLGANPPRNTALANDYRPLALPKAWATLVTNGSGGFATIDGASITSASTTTNLITVQLAQAMDSTVYAVLSTCHYATWAVIPATIRNSTNTITLNFSTADVHAGATAIDPSTVSGIDCQILVFGRQTT